MEKILLIVFFLVFVNTIAQNANYKNDLILKFLKKQLAEDIKALSFIEECSVVGKKPRFRRILKNTPLKKTVNIREL